MAYTARHRFARISPKKARPVARMIQGMPVVRALEALRFSPQRAAAILDKVLRSALSNAGVNADEIVRRRRGGKASSAAPSDEAEGMIVQSVTVDDGPVAPGTKRFIPVSRGMAHAIRRRTSHITVIIEQVATEEEQ